MKKALYCPRFAMAITMALLTIPLASPQITSLTHGAQLVQPVALQQAEAGRCPMYTLFFACKFFFLHDTTPDNIALEITNSNREKAHFDNFIALFPSRTVIDNLSGDDLFGLASQLPPEFNDCLVIHGSVESQPTASDKEAQFFANRIPYLTYIMNTSETGGGHHWVTFMVRKNAQNRLEFIGADSSNANLTTIPTVMRVMLWHLRCSLTNPQSHC